MNAAAATSRLQPISSLVSSDMFPNLLVRELQGCQTPVEQFGTCSVPVLVLSVVVTSCTDAGLEKVKEAYLPFYVTTASLRSELASAELGFQEWGTVFNPTRRRFERQLVVKWRPAIFDVVRAAVCPTNQSDRDLIKLCGYCGSLVPWREDQRKDRTTWYALRQCCLPRLEAHIALLRSSAPVISA